ncbi:glycosyltransferase family 2 protein [Arthrobacter sp. I2-34]|uniref:Glycosyltransferase family 2 protein n=1 Tax=Arthrobacter hankyongi TaxID=2904801 RepID=A0ABS9L8A7_9MICC|nr:glycosyltransferase [Arthrobacter hankyongi]MCG2622709.1 glycosyltransferase family 2 protein [Arthrobacter hankyongi]
MAEAGAALAEPVEVVIAVHSPERPVRRAVASVLAAGTPGTVRATVVCHNMDSQPVRAALAGLPGDLPEDTVRVLELRDGIPSPAGPFNHGLQHAQAPWVAIMGSDDELEPGALDAWRSAAVARGAAAAIAPVRVRGGGRILTPRARVLRGLQVDPVLDRLAYRTAPLGLIRREAVERLGLRLAPGLRTGEDLEFGLRLWFSGEPIVYPATAPCYLVGQDGGERVTGAVLPLAEQFKDVSRLLAGRWLDGLPARSRQAVAVKLLRGHVVGAALRRGPDFDWTGAEREELSRIITDIVRLAPGAPRLLSAPDEALLLSLRGSGGPPSAAAVAAALRRRQAAGLLRRSLTRRWPDNVRRESPLRANLNSLLAAASGPLRRLPERLRRKDAA